ncbi:Membrane protein [Lysobacter dokdonensis DS-58]|uniref:Membrane protein n=1 Tax=Lysobacter dokdonensis DS-58 TaxID=1300345 RepID=A0A0A2WK63_9GAMM|nr:DUF3667 domain-containing protein [Lysobacter dokdonensis]KGQ20581.1 Membrane protein [Lysobacter dokdonensis DS-58]
MESSDLTLRGLIARVAKALTNVDKRVVNTTRDLLRHPGLLTVAYVTGKRKPYVGPLQIFLLANVLFFAVQSLSTINIFGASLASHMTVQDWRGWATPLVQSRLAAAHLTLAAYEPHFNAVAEANAKSLIILMVAAFAFATWALFLRRDRPFLLHVAFALHAWAFLLVVFSGALLVSEFHVLVGGKGLASSRVDLILTAANLVACALFLYRAVHVVYGATGIGRVVRALAMTFTVMGIILGYRLLLFVVTLYATTY